jgi:hypothetical protein
MYQLYMLLKLNARIQAARTEHNAKLSRPRKRSEERAKL